MKYIMNNLCTVCTNEFTVCSTTRSIYNGSVLVDVYQASFIRFIHLYFLY